MRRNDKAITDRQQLDAIIRGSLVCRLALVESGQPYLVPLSFLAGGEVCFECERHVELRRDPQTACKWSMNFESVIGYGTIAELTADAEKRHALNQIMRQYSDKDWDFEPAIMTKTRAWKLTITSMTGKVSKPKMG